MILISDIAVTFHIVKSKIEEAQETVLKFIEVSKGERTGDEKHGIVTRFYELKK